MSHVSRKLRLAVAVAVTWSASCADALDSGQASIGTVAVVPTNASVAVGANLALSAEVRDAQGNVLAGRRVRWASEDASIADVSETGVVIGRRVGTVLIAVSAQGKDALAVVTVNPTPVAAVRLSLTSRTMLVGEAIQLGADALDEDNLVLPGRPVTWTTSDTVVATVSASGLVTALSVGGAIVTASSEGKTAIASVTVSAVPVATVDLSPGINDLVVGQSTQLTAQVRDSSGLPLAGRGVAWSTSSAQVATVTSVGLVTAISPGTATISAWSEGKGATATIRVSPRPVSAVVLSPGQVTIIAGQTTQLTATVTDDRGEALTGRPITYTSSSTSVATVSAGGLVSGVSPGSATITATSEGKTGTATVTIVPVPVATVEIGPSSASVIVGQQVQLSATPRSATGQPLTGRSVSWTSGAPGLASVSLSGLVTGLVPGTAVIIASIDGIVGSATITVRQIPVASVAVSPATASAILGQSVTLSATPRDAGGNALTGRVVGWASSNTGVATVSAGGVVTGMAIGNVTITATIEGQSGSASVSVTSPAPVPVASVTVTPPTLALQVGQTGALTATTRDAANGILIGRTVTWTSSSSTVAAISPNGSVTAIGTGVATIAATSEGKSGSSTVTVTPAPPLPVATVGVSPSTASLIVGGTQPVVATPRDSLGNALAGRVITWVSANTGVATVNQSGLVTATGVGSTTVTATSEGRTGTVSVTVAVPTVVTVTVAPTSVNVNVAWTTTLAASARDANGNVVAGALVQWSSSNAAVAAVAAVSTSGAVTGMSVGTATITATSGGRSGSASVVVQPAPVARVVVTPLDPAINAGQTVQLVATLYDALDHVLTGRAVTWTSADATKVTVSSSGLALGVKKGTVTITATSGGVTGTTDVRVR